MTLNLKMTIKLLISKTKINYSNCILNNQRQEEEMKSLY